MKLKKLFTLSAAALLGAIPLKSTAQTWQTVLNYQLAPGKAAAGPSIVADASGNVFSGGYGDDAAGTQHGIVLKTDTTQASWFLSDDSNPNPSQFESCVYNLGFDARGDLYSVGDLRPTNFLSLASSWYVRKSGDGGANWSTVDNYQPATGQSLVASGFAADGAGNVYVAGWGRDLIVVTSHKQSTTNLGAWHWLVRKSGDGGQHWTLVDDVQSPTLPIGAYGAGFVPGAGVFVVGAPYASLSGASWQVRRSLSGELGTWATVDNPFAGSAQAVGSDSQGKIYVAGSQSITTTTTVIVHNKPVTTTSTYRVWVTRMSSDGGNTWQTVDTLPTAPYSYSEAYGVGRNSDGNVVVVGQGYDAQGKWHWIVRTPDASGVWQTIDDFQLPAPGTMGTAVGVVTDAAGNLLVTGCASDATGLHWIVRKLAP